MSGPLHAQPAFELPCEVVDQIGEAVAPTDRNRLVLGDCLGLMRQLPAACIDLIYVDPPFATGREHDARTRTGTRVSFSDVWSGGRTGYLEWLAPRLEQMHRLLTRSGSLFLHLDWRAVHPAKLLLDQIFGQGHFRNEIIWHYGSGGRARRFFPRKHDVLLWYSRSGKWQFHPEAVQVERDRCPQCGTRRAKWNHLKRHVDADGRVYRTIRSAGKIYRYYDDEPTLPPDVWADLGHLQQKDPERVGYPTQKPEALLRRIVASTTGPGDLVADFFSGSGTTCAVALDLERRWIGCDASPAAVAVARQRLERRRRPMFDPGITVEHCGVLALDRAVLRSAGDFRQRIRDWLGAQEWNDGSRWIHGVLEGSGGRWPLWIPSPAGRGPVTAAQLTRFVGALAHHPDCRQAVLIAWEIPRAAQLAALELETRSGISLSLMPLQPLASPSSDRRGGPILVQLDPPPLVGPLEAERLGPLTYRFTAPGVQSRCPDDGLTSCRWASAPLDGEGTSPQITETGPDTAGRTWEHHFADHAAGRRIRVWCQVADARGASCSASIELTLE